MKKIVLLLSMLLFTGSVWAMDDEAAYEAQLAAEQAQAEQMQLEEEETLTTERQRMLDEYEDELQREKALSAGE